MGSIKEKIAEMETSETGESAVHPLVIPGEAARQAIIKHISDELDFAERMIEKHKSENHPEAANHRQEHAKKLLLWLEWLHLTGSELQRAEELRLWNRAMHVSGFSEEIRPKLYKQFDKEHPPFWRKG